MVIRISDKTQNYSKVTKLLVKPKNIKLKQQTSSGGTLPKSTAEVIGNSTFFAPESKQTCKVFAKFSTLDTVPLTLISTSTANELTVGF